MTFSFVLYRCNPIAGWTLVAPGIANEIKPLLALLQLRAAQFVGPVVEVVQGLQFRRQEQLAPGGCWKLPDDGSAVRPSAPARNDLERLPPVSAVGPSARKQLLQAAAWTPGMRARQGRGGMFMIERQGTLACATA